MNLNRCDILYLQQMAGEGYFDFPKQYSQWSVRR
jgi:hypothetical protein